MKINFDNRWRRCMILRATVPWARRKLYWNAGPKEIMDLVEEAKVNVIYIEVKGAYGLINFTSVEGERSAQFPDDSFINDFIREAHSRDIAIGAYYDVGWENTSGKINPDWLARSAKGDTYSWDVFPLEVLCTNTPYREVVLTQVRELVTQYDFDALWCDAIQYELPMEGKGVSCYCKSCRSKFRLKYGVPIPEEEDWSNPLWREFIDWKAQNLERMYRDIKTVASEANPDVRFLTNLCGVLPNMPPSMSQRADQIARWCDHIMVEAQTEREGFNGSCFTPRLGRTMGQGKPVEVAWARVPNGLDNALRRKANLKWQVFSGVANNAAPFTWDFVHPDGTLEREVYRYMGEAYEEVEKRERWLGGEPIRFAATAYSTRTRDLYAREETEKYANSVFGAAKSLSLYTPHMPWEVLTDRSLGDLEELRSYKSIVLPNTACLSDGQIDAVREYVRQGGGLVATYQTSMFDENGAARGDFGLADVFGCSFVDGFEVEGAFMEPVQGSSLANEYWTYPHNVLGRPLKVESAEDCVTEAVFRRSFNEGLSKYRYYAALQVSLGERTRYPAVVRREHGKGRVVYMPGLVCDNFGRYSYEAFGRLIADAVLWAAAEEPPITVEAPTNVHVSHFTKDGDIVVHLLSFHCEPLKRGDPVTLVEGILVNGVRIRSRKPIRKALFVSADKEIAAATHDGLSTIELPPLDQWETVVLSV